MQNLFNDILKMSVSAVPVIVVVLCLRQLFKRYPKSYSFALWLLVFASLAIPFKIPVNITLPTEKVTNEITQTIVQEFASETVHGGTQKAEQNVQTAQNEQNNTQKVPVIVQQTEQQTNVTVPHNAVHKKLFTLQLWHIWLCGLLLLAAFEIVNLKGIYDKTRFAFKKQGNIYLCDEIGKPFVFGIAKPKIFIPSDISPLTEQFVIRHEQSHINRRDYIIKPLCFVIAIVHWFNPLVWLSFALMVKDMELSCDEKVAKKLDTTGVQQYCTALLAFAVKDKPYKINAVLFGEGNCTMRIKNILQFKQPKKLTAILLSVCVLFAGCTAFATGQTEAENTESTNNTAALYVEHLDTGVTKTITDENDIGAIAQILSSQNWQEGTADCLSEFKISLDGKEYYYHSDCGTVNDGKNNHSLSLTDEQKSEIDRIIASMPQTEKVDENEQMYYMTETDSAWVDENDDICGYPTQEYFKEETETAAETVTETVDQWSAFPEVIHLPMLEAGKYVFPLDMTNEAVRINRGYTGQYPKHDGIDIAAPYGTEIFASADGKVIKSEESTVGDGNHVVIEHANGYYTLYGHCSKLLVKEGDEVKQGDLIAKIGSTGNSTGNHLHFEFGFGYDSEPNGGLSLDPYNAVGTRCLEDLNSVSINEGYQQSSDDNSDIQKNVDEEQYYIAQAGDSPISIAKAHKLNVDELYAMNPDIKENGVFVGDKVRVTQPIFGWPIGEGPTGEGVRISRGFVGQYPDYNGVAIAGPKGTDIVASADGRVIKAYMRTDNYGNYIVIQHTGGYRTLYAHCSVLLVKMGDYVNKGDVIAKMGSTGNATGNQLHFEIILENDTRIDPYTKW